MYFVSHIYELNGRLYISIEEDEEGMDLIEEAISNKNYSTMFFNHMRFTGEHTKEDGYEALSVQDFFDTIAGEGILSNKQERTLLSDDTQGYDEFMRLVYSTNKFEPK